MLGLSKLFKTPRFIPTWWYMSLAVIIIVLMPALLRLYHQFGILLLPVCLIVFRMVKLRNHAISDWFLCIVTGIIFADLELLPKIKEWALRKRHWFSPGLKFLLLTLLLIFSVALRQSRFGSSIHEICDGIIPAYVICYCHIYLIHIKGLRQLLCLLGRYSMTMFLTHTFIRRVWLADFTYHWKYAGLIWLSLLLTSLPLAMLLDWLKKATGYQKVWDGWIDRICSHICQK